MAATLRPGGLLVLTSCNWELVRDRGSGLRIAEQLVDRDGRRALVAHGWTLAEGWEDPHYLDAAVAFIDESGSVTGHGWSEECLRKLHASSARASASTSSQPHRGQARADRPWPMRRVAPRPSAARHRCAWELARELEQSAHAPCRRGPRPRLR